MAIIPSTAKVLNQYENVNTTYGGSKAMKAQSKWYTMQDIEDTINASKPYKVFTALVSQTGNDSQQTAGAEAPIVLGVTYLIDDNSNDVDLTVFGAPNSNVGTSFICTTAGTLPNDPGILLIYNDGAPVATILENTIGNVWFTYDDVGKYNILSNDLFTENKTFINGARFTGPYNVFNSFVNTGLTAEPNRGYFFSKPDGQVELIVLNTLKGDGMTNDGIIANPICVEIKVYN